MATTWADVWKLLKDNLSLIIAGVVAGILLWLFSLGGLDWLRGLFHTAKIEAASKSRRAENDFFAGEVVRFSLEGVAPDKVVWDFDESDIEPGSTEVEHAFPFDTKASRGIRASHRVDAFYRRGDAYEPTSIHINVLNVQLVTLSKMGDKISVSVSKSPFSNWAPTGLSLAKFEGGKFNVRETITNPANNHLSSWTLDLPTLKRAFGLGESYDPDATRGTTATVEFSSPDGSGKIETIQNLDFELKGLEASRDKLHQ